ncbi:RICIN domain-containing protein [Actinomadura sp. 1N219]|uniref:RICIN domain-containing protein n=1 Tax=Actinomadura sp. 1N219 TaxID=3375152 RepID=UPI00378F082F
MRRSTLLMLLPVITVLGGYCTVQSASADPSPRPESQRALAGVSIKPKGAADVCLEVADANTGNGALVTLWPCTGNDNQKWIFAQGRIQSALPGNNCLDVRGGNAGNGAAINSYDCNSGSPQQWRFSGDRLVSGLNGMCLSVLDNNFGGGGAVVNFHCNGGAGQAWETS